MERTTPPAPTRRLCGPFGALLLTATVAAGVAACGSSNTGTGATRHSTASANGSTTAAASRATASTAPAIPAEYFKTDADKDNDPGTPGGDDTSNSRALMLGHEASTAEKRTIAAFIRRYYETALSEDGAKGCAMLYSTFAEALPEDYGSQPGQPPGQPYMRGSTCSTIMTGLFKHFHPILTIELPKMQVLSVRLQEHHGIALLGFGNLPERTISFTREGHIWKMTALLDRELP